MEPTTFVAKKSARGDKWYIVEEAAAGYRIILDDLREEWAKRIAACLNACAAHSTEAIVSGTVKMQAAEPKTESFAVVFERIRQAGGSTWDKIADPDAFIRWMRGDGPERPDFEAILSAKAGEPEGAEVKPGRSRNGSIRRSGSTTRIHCCGARPPKRGTPPYLHVRRWRWNRRTTRGRCCRARVHQHGELRNF